jgi:hypothetical protein
MRVRLLAFASVLAVLVVTSGCSGGGGSEGGGGSQVEVGQAAPTAPKESESVASPKALAIPDPCTVLTMQQVADAAGIGQYPLPYDVPGVDFISYQDGNIAYCNLALNAEAKSQLNVDDYIEDGKSSVVVAVSTYNGHRYSSSLNDWFDTDPDALLSSYYAAHQEKIGSNGLAEFVPGSGDRVIQDDATVVAAIDDRYWLKVTFFSCSPADCGAAALGVAQAYIPAVAAS